MLIALRLRVVLDRFCVFLSKLINVVDKIGLLKSVSVALYQRYYLEKNTSFVDVWATCTKYCFESICLNKNSTYYVCIYRVYGGIYYNKTFWTKSRFNC